jgi:hypothetical protein
LLVILDDATSEIYYAQLVDEESTRTVMAGLRDVIERVKWRATLASCTVTAHQHLDGTLSPRQGRTFWDSTARKAGRSRTPWGRNGCGKDGGEAPWKTLRVSHVPTTPATEHFNLLRTER